MTLLRDYRRVDDDKTSCPPVFPVGHFMTMPLVPV